MKLMVCSDWLPEGASSLHSGFTAFGSRLLGIDFVSVKKKIKNERSISTHLDRTRLVNNAFQISVIVAVLF